MLEDKDIIELYKIEGRQHEAFRLLVAKYQERLYWHIRKLTSDHDDANDLLQMTLIKIWRNLSSFREEAKLYTWLYRIATNEALTFLKKQKLHSFLSLTDYEKVLENRIDSDIYFNADDAQKRLLKAVSKLPNKQKIVFNLRYFEEMKYEDISEILGTSVGAIKASYHHAKEKVTKSINIID